MRISITSNIVDLHGVLLRDILRKILFSSAKGQSLVGEVRNVEDGVEIVCESDISKEEINKLIWEAINHNELIENEYKNERFIVVKHRDKLFDNGFKLKRSSELQETVWALQGAGKVFRGIGEQIKQRDKIKILGLLKGIKYETYFNETLVNDPLDYHHNAIEKFLCEIPLDDEELISMLQNYLLLCKLEKRSKRSRLETSKLSTKLTMKLDNLIDQMEQKNKNIKGGESS